MSQGARRSGLYHIKLPGTRSSFWQLLVYCEQDVSGGGWMVKFSIYLHEVIFEFEIY